MAKPRPLHSNSQHSGTGAIAAVTVGDLSQEAIGDFWRQEYYISSRSDLKGLNGALEGYINHFIVEKVTKKLQLQAKM